MLRLGVYTVNIMQDIFGIRPVGKAFEKLVNEAAEYMGLLLKPAATETGLWLKDYITIRRQNATNIALKSKQMSETIGLDKDDVVDPRIVFDIIEQGSKVSDERLITMWAGLLTASRSKKPNDENLIYISRLERMTVLEAKVFEF